MFNMSKNDQLILDRINEFIDGEGYRKERLAQMMGKSPSAFYAHLQGKHLKTIYQFAVELAEALGLSSTFFIDDHYDYSKPEVLDLREKQRIVFSAGILSKKGEEGLSQLWKLCDLIKIYD